jgi:hypothetical protein
MNGSSALAAATNNTKMANSITPGTGIQELSGVSHLLFFLRRRRGDANCPGAAIWDF